MLVLTRKTDERICIDTPEGRRVVLTVVEIRGNQVRIGLEAPDEVKIQREEHLAPALRPPRRSTHVVTE